MAAILVSAKFLFFDSMINKTFPKSSQRFYLAQTLIKSIKPHLNRVYMNYLLLNRKKINTNKIGLPPNKRYRLTRLARHDDFNDAHIKDKN